MFQKHRHALYLMMVALASLAACGDEAANPAPEPEVTPEPDLQPEAEPDGAVVLGLHGANEPLGVCAGVSDAPCGGDLSGVWQLTDFCTPDPAGEDRSCEGPGEDEAACEGDASSRTCNLLYGGRMDFVGDEIRADLSVGIRVRYHFDDACLAALGAGGEASCDGLATTRLSCEYSPNACDCEAGLEPETEALTIAYSAEGERIVVGDGGRAAEGSYCVQGDRLTIVFDSHGPEGWRAWVLER